MNKYNEAKLLLDRALAYYEKQFRPYHQETLVILSNIAALSFHQLNSSEEKPFFERVLKDQEKVSASVTNRLLILLVT